jgi:hypothetical protein
MPETTVVEATAEESRTYDVLVTQARIDAIIVAAEAYCRLNANAYPAAFQEMIEPPSAISARMLGCRLDAEGVLDSWGKPIFYAVMAGRIIVRSAGADGRFTTEDDIGQPGRADAHVEAFDVGRECQQR